MTVFSSGMSHRSFLWQITAVSFALGITLALTWNAATQVGHGSAPPIREGFVYGSTFSDSARQTSGLEDEVRHLRHQNQDLNDELAKRTGVASAINQELKDAEEFGGLTDVDGPGVQVTLNDSHKRPAMPGDPLSLNVLIHDADIAQVVNELKVAGAEAVAVNGQRIVSSSTIRCVGPVIQINGVQEAPPYIVQAIGDPAAMYGGINLPNGVLDQLRQQDPAMVHVAKVPRIHLAAFDGSTQMRFAHVPGKDQHDSSSEREQ